MDAEQILRRAGLRVTVARREVLDVLLEAEHALSSPDIAAHSGLRDIDRVTVYRCVAALCAAGLAHGVSGVDGVCRYRAHERDGVDCPGDHPHFLCTDCGGMWCLPGQRLSYVEVPAGALVDGKQLVVHGRCVACLQGEGA
jgi:Fur family transcriptional regulator, ferric uptake regulator